MLDVKLLCPHAVALAEYVSVAEVQQSKCCSQHLHACFKYQIHQQKFMAHAKAAEDDLRDSSYSWFHAVYDGKTCT